MLYAVHTDIGNVKKVNQDSAVIKKASTEKGEIMFAAVCDGMGGLRNGEIASAEVAEALSEWFTAQLPLLVSEGITSERLKESLNDVILAQDEKISAFSRKCGDCGTTLAGIFLCGGRYMCVNVGDSRIYMIRGGQMRLLTHDQTVVQRMIDSGEITKEQALTHKMRSVLLQCIGVEGDVVPDYTEGTYEKGDTFLVCSDGFVHKVREEELPGFFPAQEMRNEKRMRRAAVIAVEENMKRGERDNITVVVLRT